MGIVFTRLFSSVFGNREARILVLGLDNAGKTTILYRLQMGEVVSTIPTIGFNVETVQYNNIKFQVWDLGGQTSIRPYWRCYFPNTQAIIYVVDSSDTDRLVTAKEEFHSILEPTRSPQYPKKKSGASKVHTVRGTSSSKLNCANVCATLLHSLRQNIKS
ncbi:unnamed protein product [Triticum turgidum subsp. durum]|uniref:ADP-ribosylation factor n=1 Tax=Triticum turgidum subsp. durum TaxID=4567 RepID=A0A9R1A1Y3_TRITD|nr:unnamed protein product [Triticum turgidum subsp. durum]